MKSFAAADHVIGLDVDRDRFDKFVFRDSISSLLAELWKDEGSAEQTDTYDQIRKSGFTCSRM